MILRRIDAGSTWEEHYEQHVNPKLMTKLLRAAVPVLKAVDWQVLDVKEGHARSLLPLNGASTNQHATHQAALIGLSADYTGGLALASLLKGVPLAGIHRCSSEESASLWLADMSVRFKSPSTGNLEAVCDIDEKTAKTISDRYSAGKRVFATLPVHFTSGGEPVAEATMKYFAQPSSQLQSSSATDNVSPIMRSKLKASARMIAGVRAQSTSNRRLRLDSGHSKLAATEHGILLADRLRSALPQLTDMVHARTQHGDELLLSIRGLEQVVLIGSGLDMRPYEHYEKRRNLVWFELDLPVMLEERQRIVSQFDSPPSVQRRAIAIDLLQDCVAERLLAHPDFDAEKKTLFIYEGCSMYFDAAANQKILRSVASLLRNRMSCVWCDLVGTAVVDGSSSDPGILQFLDGMENLGERFIFGHDTPQDFLQACGLKHSIFTTSGDYLGTDDPVHGLYRFIVAK